MIRTNEKRLDVRKCAFIAAVIAAVGAFGLGMTVNLSRTSDVTVERTSAN